MVASWFVWLGNVAGASGLHWPAREDVQFWISVVSGLLLIAYTILNIRSRIREERVASRHDARGDRDAE
jgi:ABC-type nickel/cobalt efflux system permease component RcnA